MNFTVKDLADYAQVTVKEMIAQLTAKAPDVNWKAATPVPDTLVQLFMEGVDQYKATNEPIGVLTSANGGDGASITQMRINAEATQYALVESLAQVDMRDIITTAIAHSLGEIEIYEMVKAQIWGKYVESRIESGKVRTDKLAGDLKTQAANRQRGISDRLTAQAKTSTTAQTILDEGKAFLAQTLASI